MKTPLVRDIGILIARLVIGVIFLAHGLQKFDTWGYEGTKAGFEGMGAPAPAISAFVATWTEILGGLALILGVLVPLFGVLLFLLMLGAFFIVHIENGIYASDGGFELVAALGAGALLLAAVGSGAFGVDRVLARKVPLLRAA
ncbi:Inner membrane protein yqjF [Rhodococcus gordoniae]|uniref:Inner membrane protein yqjF n=1 Tax=Rhodococcus gordoniae TaxID=223392 RepID=A0A379M5R1_9NOCA|nr:DoxX family protein [Rhodococcus gordoniae]SUE16953.1 Inner membrane protein yqjF [Rhodococcus gordoniae]